MKFISTTDASVTHSDKPSIIVLLLALFLTACGGGGGGGSDGTSNNMVSPTSNTISGSIGDGPIVGSIVTITDANGNQLTAISDSQANYQLDIPAGTVYPLTITATGGTDLVTNAAPTFTMESVILDPTVSVANASPFTTLIKRTAENMGGGLSPTNIANARLIVVDALNFGFDITKIPDPVTSRITDENIADIVTTSERLAELFRRIRSNLLAGGSSPSENQIIDSVAGDLTDNVLDGRGPGADPRISVTANVASAEILLESFTNKLNVDGVDATARMNNAIFATHPSSVKTTADVLITAEMITQAQRGIIVAQSIAPSTSLDAIESALNIIAPRSSYTNAESILPASSTTDIGQVFTSITSASSAQLEIANAVARNNSASGNGDANNESGNSASISNTSPSSYVWGTLSIGQPVYIDRTYAFTSIPAGYSGLVYLRTANDDKNRTGNSFLTFDISEPSTIYVAYAFGFTTPTWLADWTDTGEVLSNTDRDMRIFRKDYPAGNIVLGGNQGSPSMYSVFASTTQLGGGNTGGGNTGGNGVASLTWTPPITNEDGTVLSDLAGYRIYYGTSEGNLTSTATINNPGISSYMVENLSPGTYYFAVSAFDYSGNESAKSNMATHTVSQ